MIVLNSNENTSLKVIKNIIKKNGIDQLEVNEVVGLIRNIQNKKVAKSALNLFKNYKYKKEVALRVLDIFGPTVIKIWKLELSSEEIYEYGIKYGIYELFSFIPENKLSAVLYKYISAGYSFVRNIRSYDDYKNHPKPLLYYIPEKFYSDIVINEALKMDIRNAKYITLNEDYAITIAANYRKL